MTVFSANGVTKTYNDKTLFEDISFGMESGERIGIIGNNGAGKTTLMKIIAGIEPPDTGEVIFNNSVRCEYLDQEPRFESYDLIIDYTMKGRKDIHDYFNRYSALCKIYKDGEDAAVKKELNQISEYLDLHNGWSLENEAQKILSILGLNDYIKPINELSGGLKKRAALARALISNPELLIMDEPTNHLDADSVQWLQDRLMDYNNSLLFVTHDRYFLDAVATKIIEIDRKKLYIYYGNYELYLEKKEAVASSLNAALYHQRSRLRMELAWLQRGARARRTKAKSRIDWIKVLEDDTYRVKEKDIKIEVGKSFIGSRVIEAHNISKSIGDKVLFSNFTYIAVPGDRIGIIGVNGCGKTTLLNVLAGIDFPETGNVKVGASIKIGYFRQEMTDLPDNQTVIGALREIAEYIDAGVGRDRYLTTKDLLNKFNFPPSRHGSFIGTLSGGEKKRLALIRLLMGNPNVLLLDEPTNDFDLNTMNALEDYLDNFYGTLLVVSHDRAFLDRIVNTIYCFEGNGKIKPYPGNYSAYLERKETESRNRMDNPEPTAEKTKRIKNPDSRKKLTFSEQREFENIEKEIPVLEAKQQELHEMMNSGKITDYKEYDTLSNTLAQIEEEIENKTNRWMELSEKITE